MLHVCLRVKSRATWSYTTRNLLACSPLCHVQHNKVCHRRQQKPIMHAFCGRPCCAEHDTVNSRPAGFVCDIMVGLCCQCWQANHAIKLDNTVQHSRVLRKPLPKHDMGCTSQYTFAQTVCLLRPVCHTYICMNGLVSSVLRRHPQQSVKPSP